MDANDILIKFAHQARYLEYKLISWCDFLPDYNGFSDSNDGYVLAFCNSNIEYNCVSCVICTYDASLPISLASQNNEIIQFPNNDPESVVKYLFDLASAGCTIRTSKCNMTYDPIKHPIHYKLFKHNNKPMSFADNIVVLIKPYQTLENFLVEMDLKTSIE